MADDMTTDRLKELLAQITPTPWKYGRASKPVDGAYDWGIKGYVDGKFQVIAEAFGRSGEDNFPPAMANAALIALAPTLAADLLALRAKADALAEEVAKIKRHVWAIAVGLKSPIHGEDPYGWYDCAAEADRLCDAALAAYQEDKP